MSASTSTSTRTTSSSTIAIRWRLKTMALLQLLLLSLGWTTTKITEAFVPIKTTRATSTKCRGIKTVGTTYRTTTATKLFSQDEDEDDGWGTAENDGTTASPSSSIETDRKVNEVRSLREQASSTTSTNSNSSGAAAEERDLFIPIMAVVSLAGLFGAYGYETLRLASRGELYLPF